MEIQKKIFEFRKEFDKIKQEIEKDERNPKLD